MPKYAIAANYLDGSVRTLLEDKGWVNSSHDDADFIVFTGGADINPELYGQRAHISTSFHRARDEAEVEVYRKYEKTKHFIGICRGFQLLSVLAGGWLLQDSNNHGGTKHKLYVDPSWYKAEDPPIVNSCHHQVVQPHDYLYEMATAEQATLVAASDESFAPDPRENPEIEMGIIRGRHYGVQFHPEWCKQSAEVFWTGFNYYQKEYIEKCVD